MTDLYTSHALSQGLQSHPSERYTAAEEDMCRVCVDVDSDIVTIVVRVVLPTSVSVYSWLIGACIVLEAYPAVLNALARPVLRASP